MFLAYTWPKYTFSSFKIYTCIYQNTNPNLQAGDECVFSDTKYADNIFIFTPFEINLD